ncbi:MAG TPA: Ig-like domain-containing protein [Vicinamibacterales bacterium]
MGYLRDELHFIYMTVSGDLDISARVDAISSSAAEAKAGLSIRGSLAEDASFATAMVSQGKGVTFQRRRATGGGSKSNAVGGQSPRWVRLVRSGSRVTSYTSVDGSSWQTIGSETISMGNSVYVGIAAVSTDPAITATTDVSSISLNGSPMTPPPSSQLPAGQTSGDVGSPAIAGSVSFSGGQYTIKAAGSDIWDPADEFHFVYQPVDGDVEVIARVRSITNVDPSAKAGVMIRESLANDSSHAFAVVTAAKNYALQSRPNTGSRSHKISAGSGPLPGWVRLVRKGTSFTAYQSADGVNWKYMGTRTVQMNTTAFVGIAVTSDTVSAATTVVVDGFKVVQASTPSNKPPTVMLTAPADGATYTAPASVTLTASAADSDGTVTSVEFYANGTLVGKDTSAPFSVAGTLQEGSYAITAVAYDNAGASTVSGTINVTVSASQTQPAPAPTGVAFAASTTHSSVSQYVLEIHKAGQTPGSSTAMATSNLGKPAPNAAGDIVVDMPTFFQGLPAGDYVATVVAKNSTTSARSSAVTFTR